MNALVPGGRISSGYGPRQSPGGIGSTNHQGIDIAAPRGTPVYAPRDLQIKSAGNMGGFGNTVVASDGSNEFYFAHLNTIGVKPGMSIPAGTQLGTVGSTGTATGPHLHLGVKNAAGQWANPATFGLTEARLRTTSQRIKEGVRDGLKSIPVYGDAIAGVTDAVGLTSECGILCQIKNWFETSQFFTRLALGVLALILIYAAFYLFGTGQTQKLIKGIA